MASSSSIAAKMAGKMSSLLGKKPTSGTEMWRLSEDGSKRGVAGPSLFIKFKESSGYVFKTLEISKDCGTQLLPAYIGSKYHHSMVVVFPKRHDYVNYGKSTIMSQQFFYRVLSCVNPSERWRFTLGDGAYLCENGVIVCQLPCILIYNEQVHGNFGFRANGSIIKSVIGEPFYSLFGNEYLVEEYDNKFIEKNKYYFKFKREEGVSPLFKGVSSPVFKTMEACLNLLHSVKTVIPVVCQLLDVVSRVPPILLQYRGPKKKPFVIMEGLDCSGKTHLSRLKAKENPDDMYVYGLMEDMVKFREEFDTFPEIIKRCFYTVSNLRMSRLVSDFIKEKRVILDRSWHSSIAYGLANEATCESELPPAGDPIYDWPAEMIKPDEVCCVMMGESEHLTNMRNKFETLTKEELRIFLDGSLKNRLKLCYKRAMNQSFYKVMVNEYSPNGDIVSS